MSLDGYLSGNNGDIDWLLQHPNPEKLDCGYAEFYKNNDTTLMGKNTYKEVLTFDVPFPYPDKINYASAETPCSKNFIGQVTSLLLKRSFRIKSLCP